MFGGLLEHFAQGLVNGCGKGPQQINIAAFVVGWQGDGVVPAQLKQYWFATRAKALLVGSPRETDFGPRGHVLVGERFAMLRENLGTEGAFKSARVN